MKLALLALFSLSLPVQMHCAHAGRLVTCWTTGAEDRLLVPYWTVWTPRPYHSFGDDVKFDAPKKWTRVTVSAFGDDDHETVAACGEVRWARDTVEFHKLCTKETAPHAKK